MRLRLVLLGTTLIVAFSSQVFASVPKSGSPCTKYKATKFVGGKKFTCIKVGEKLMWGKSKKLSSTKVKSATSPQVLPKVIPGSSDKSCNFLLSPIQGQDLFISTYGTPLLQEGALPTGIYHPASGKHKALMVYVNYKDAPGVLGAIRDIRALQASRLDYFEEVSFGLLSVTLDSLNEVVTLPKTPQQYGSIGAGDPSRVKSAQDSLFMDLIAAIDAKVDLSSYKSLWLISAQNTLRATWGNHGITRAPGYGFKVDGVEIRHFVTADDFLDSARDGKTAVHEFAHLLGLADLVYGEFGDAPGALKEGLYPIGRWDPMTGEPVNGPNLVHFLGWHKYLLGWLEPIQVTCQLAPGLLEETLSPIALKHGKKLIVVPISESVAYVFEVRRRIGLDAQICKEGVLVYRVDSQVRNGEGPIQSISPEKNDCLPNGTPFVLGQKYQDLNIDFEIIGDDGTNFRIRLNKR